MRKLLGLMAALGLALSVAVPAQATVMAVSSGSLYILTGLPQVIVVPWSGTGSADVTATSITGLTASIFNVANLTVPVSDPFAIPIAGIYVPSASNGAGNFTFDGLGNGGGTMAVTGSANFCLFQTCSAPPPANLVVPFTTGSANGMGLGGSPIMTTEGFTVTVTGNGWTTGAASLGAITVTGSPLSNNEVTLVTPTVISPSAGTAFPVVTVMSLRFVPEPGTLLLLALGVAGLAVLGRRGMSK